MIPTSPPEIVFQDVDLVLGEQPLFRQFSLVLPAGQCSCILGPSGCGKSTLLRLISGDPAYLYEGQIRIGTDQSERPKVAWMSQSDLLLPWLTLEENVLLGSRLRGDVTIEKTLLAQNLLMQAGLVGYEHALPHTLSGGMRQRGALLRTLMEDCSLLLMDEPFSALDALTRVKLQNLSAQMTAGKTTVLVTHDPMEALRMGHNIYVLSSAPTCVLKTVSLAGTPPRGADDPVIRDHYSDLLRQLMRESSL